MPDIFPDRIQFVPLEQIDGEDRFFSISPRWTRNERLTLSVKQAGILTPLVLQLKNSGSLRIVRGFQRFLAAGLNALEKLPALVRPPSSPEKTLFLEAVWENLGTRQLNEIEKSMVLYKLQSQFRVPSLDLTEEFLPALGLKADRYHLDLYLAVARLPEILARSVLAGLDLKTALNLSQWKANAQQLFCDIVSEYQLSISRQRELFQLAEDLRARERREFDAIWEECGAFGITQKETLNAAGRFMQILKLLHQRRYPVLSQHEERFQQLKGALRLPPQIRFQAPPFFEGDRVSIAFDVNSADQLKKFCDKLRETAGRKELEEIFALL